MRKVQDWEDEEGAVLREDEEGLEEDEEGPGLSPRTPAQPQQPHPVQVRAAAAAMLNWEGFPWQPRQGGTPRPAAAGGEGGWAQLLHSSGNSQSGNLRDFSPSRPAEQSAQPLPAAPKALISSTDPPSQLGLLRQRCMKRNLE